MLFRSYLAVERERVHVVPHGLDLAGHGRRAARAPGAPARIGFLARICHDKGLHHLVEACELLVDAGAPPFKLHAAGYLGAGDRPYLRDLERRAAAGPLAGRFTYHGELDRAAKIAFLQSLDVLSTPTVYRESKGLPVLEAWANAVPVVVPDHGTFPELVASTGGGLLYPPGDVAQLAARLREVLEHPELRDALGDAGQRAVHERYHAEAMARQTLDLYRRLSRRPAAARMA